MKVKEICDVVMKLYLYADNAKMVHYSTTGNHYHELCDEIRGCILNFVDEFAEQTFGYYGKPSYYDFKLNQNIKQTNDLDVLCNNVLEAIAYYRTELNKNEKMSGTVSLIDDFKGALNKLKFLCTFDKVANAK